MHRVFLPLARNSLLKTRRHRTPAREKYVRAKMCCAPAGRDKTRRRVGRNARQVSRFARPGSLCSLTGSNLRRSPSPMRAAADKIAKLVVALSQPTCKITRARRSQMHALTSVLCHNHAVCGTVSAPTINAPSKTRKNCTLETSAHRVRVISHNSDLVKLIRSEICCLSFCR